MGRCTQLSAELCSPPCLGCQEMEVTTGGGWPGALNALANQTGQIGDEIF